MLSLATPWALLALPLPLLVWWLAPPHRNRVSAIRIPFFRQVTGAANLSPRAGAVVLGRSHLQMAAAIAAWVLTVVGIAGPERLGEPQIIEKAARDIVIGLDISGSMDARDFTGTDGENLQRLEAVKRVIAQFIADRDGDRVALIIFGSRAFVQAPFTEDLQSLTGFLDQTIVGMAGPQTALGDAIGLAIRTFEASEVDERLMILLSDGADTSSRMTPVNAAAVAADKGVTIYTIAVGDPGASGDDRVDLAALEAIARETGGGFSFAGDEAALEAVYAEIDAQNPRAVETLSYRPRESLRWLPFGLAFAIMAAALGWLALSGRRAAA